MQTNARQISWGLRGLWSPSHCSSLQCWQPHTPSSSALLSPISSVQLTGPWPIHLALLEQRNCSKCLFFSSHRILLSKLAEISPQREACLPLAHPSLAWALLTWPKSEHLGRLERWREDLSYWEGWDCGHAEQPLVFFHQGIILPMLLHKSQIFCKFLSAWAPLAQWCNTHPVLWCHWVLGWGG